MTIYRVDPEVTNVHLNPWSLRTVVWADGSVTDHVVGYEYRFKHGRVSSPIVDVERETTAKVLVTRSGKRYHLEGPATEYSHPDAEYVWNNWLAVNDKIVKVESWEVNNEKFYPQSDAKDSKTKNRSTQKGKKGRGKTKK